MRNINPSEFAKIIEGRDYEFLINGYGFRLKHDVELRRLMLDSRHIFRFQGCHFQSLSIEDSNLSSRWIFDNCSFKEIRVKSSRINRLELTNCIIEDFSYEDNSQAGTLKIGACRIKMLRYLKNLKFSRLEIGCENLLDQVEIKENGINNSISSSFYLCPEKFNQIRIDDFSVHDFEIGTFGEYSNLHLNKINADSVTLRNCNSDNSTVLFQNFSPLKKKAGLLKLANSKIRHSVFDKDFFKNFLSVEITNSEVQGMVHEI